MNYKTTLFLLALLLIVGGFFWFVADKQPPQPDADHPGGTRLLPDLEPEHVNAVTLDRGRGDEKIELIDQAWFQTSPVRFPLNEWSGKDLASAVAELRWREQLAPGKGDVPDAQQFGFEPARATLRVSASVDGKDVTHTIELGRTATGSRAYVRLADSPTVYVVSDRLHKMTLDATMDDWRRTTLIVPATGELDALTLSHGDTRVEAIKRDGGWAMVGDHAGRAGEQAITQLVQQVSSIFIRKFAPSSGSDLSIFGLDEPRLVLSLGQTTPTDLGANKWTLRIGGPVDLKGESFFATWNRADGTEDSQRNSATPVVVFEIAKADAERLEKSVDDLRDPRLVLAQPTDVRQIEVHMLDSPTQAGQGFTLLHGAEGWSFGKPDPGFAIDSTLASKLLTDLVGARATSYRVDAPRQAQPDVTIVVNAIGRTEPEVLRVFVGDDAKAPLLVLRNEETTGYLVPADQLSAALGPVTSLRNRVVLDLPAAELASLLITQPDGTMFAFTQTPSKAGEGEAAAGAPTSVWSLGGAEAFERSALDALLSEMSPLRAVQWVSSGRLDDADATRVKATRRDGSTVTLSIDSAKKLASVSTMPDGQVFEPTPALIESAGAEYRHRTILPMAQNRIAQVTIQDGSSAAVVITRDAAGRYAVDGRDDLNQTAAGGLFDALGGLRALRWMPSAGVKLDQASPARTLVVQYDDGSTHTLRLWRPAANDPSHELAKIDDRALLASLTPQSAAKLHAAVFAGQGVNPDAAVVPDTMPDMMPPFK